MEALAVFDDGSTIAAGWTRGSWETQHLGERDFAATKLDVDGNVSWKWQVKSIGPISPGLACECSVKNVSRALTVSWLSVSEIPHENIIHIYLTVKIPERCRQTMPSSKHCVRHILCTQQQTQGLPTYYSCVADSSVANPTVSASGRQSYISCPDDVFTTEFTFFSLTVCF